MHSAGKEEAASRASLDGVHEDQQQPQQHQQHRQEKTTQEKAPTCSGTGRERKYCPVLSCTVLYGVVLCGTLPYNQHTQYEGGDGGAKITSTTWYSINGWRRHCVLCTVVAGAKCDDWLP